jgi:hypothetical protein
LVCLSLSLQRGSKRSNQLRLLIFENRAEIDDKVIVLDARNYRSAAKATTQALFEFS